MSNPSFIANSSSTISIPAPPEYDPPRYVDVSLTDGMEEDIGHLLCEARRVSGIEP
jgi:hypothetical protein